MGSPVGALRAAACELDDGYAVLGAEGFSETRAEAEFGAEVAEVIHRAERFPGGRDFHSAAEGVAENDIVLGLRERLESGHLRDLRDEGVFAFHVALTGEHEESDVGFFRQRQAVFVSARFDRERFSDGVEVGGGEGFAHLELSLGAKMVVGLSAAHDLEGEVGRGHPAQQGVRPHDQVLLLAEDGEVAAVIHAPDAFLADFADEPRQLRRVEIAAEPGDEPGEARGVVGVELAVEHVVFALMPYDCFEVVAQSAPVEFLQRLANELERSRVELLAFVRRVGVPVEGDGCSSIWTPPATPTAQ